MATDNDDQTDEKPLATFANATGTITFDDHELTITCTITISQDGTINITTQPFDQTMDTAWVRQYVPGRERLAKWAKLRATTNDGERLQSDHVVMTGRNDHSGPDGTTIALNGELSTLTAHYDDPPATATDCRALYWTVGMRGFGVQHATTPLGTLRLAGQTDIKDYDHLAGMVQLQATSAQPFDQWVNDCDEQVTNLLLIIALAEGKLLEWSVRETSKNDRVIKRDFYGPRHTGTPRDGIFHWLNLQPVVDLALSNYTQELRDTTGIELAIRLLLAQPLHVELQLISAMTALEHLTSVHDKHQPPAPPLDTPTFRKLNKQLLHAYDTAAAALQPDEELRNRLARVRARIGNLNHLTFKDRLWHMLLAYDVPLIGIADRINPAIDARNDIIHTGKHDVPYEALTLHVAVLRELLKRVILTLLDHKGQYISFLNGQEFLNFPPP